MRELMDSKSEKFDVLILRGIPGSGKSYYANELKRNARSSDYNVSIVSADQYFVDKEGNYNFDPTKIGEAHEYSFNRFIWSISSRTNLVIVDNTNTKLWELAPYRMYALTQHYSVSYTRFYCDPITCFRRNVHGVPLSVMARMDRDFEDLPPFMGREEFIVTSDVQQHEWRK